MVMALIALVLVLTSLISCSMTTKGVFEIEILSEWSPLGAKRYLDLVADNFYTDIPMYRSVAGFLTQVRGVEKRRVIDTQSNSSPETMKHTR